MSNKKTPRKISDVKSDDYKYIGPSNVNPGIETRSVQSKSRAFSIFMETENEFTI